MTAARLAAVRLAAPRQSQPVVAVIGIVHATRRRALHRRRLLRALIRLLAVAVGSLTRRTIQTWRRQRRFIIRIRKSAGAPAHIARRWRKILLVVIAAYDGRQPLLVVGSGWWWRRVLRQSWHSRQSRCDRQSEQETSRRSNHYPPSAAIDRQIPALIARGCRHIQDQNTAISLT